MKPISAAGVLFTDARHRAIFINTALQRMLGVDEADVGQFIGEPSHQLLGMEVKAYQAFIDDIQKHDASTHQTIIIHNRDGQSLEVGCDCTINRDAQGNLMGLDFAFSLLEHAAYPSEEATSELSRKMAEEVVRYYFKRQIEGLYDVMTHVGGKRLGQYLEDAINTTATQNGWDVVMQANSITIGNDTLSFDAYQGLLFKAASYASTAIGSQIINKRIMAIDEQTNPTTFDFIQRNWFQRLS